MSNEPLTGIEDWLANDPQRALEASASAARRQIPGYLGVCVSAILMDHSIDKEADPNIHELAYTLLTAEGG
jgi:hypothetical protein